MQNLPQSEALDLELENQWLTVWFNQPEIRNPLTAARVSGLIALCAALETRRDIRGVTFRGRGGVFCAGGDLKGFKQAFAGGREAIDAMSLTGGEMFNAINALPQLTVMAVEGAAMAGGFGLLCTADIVITDIEARFALTETMIGLNPAQITPHVLARLGTRIGRRLMMTAASFKGEEAVQLGLADEVVEGPSELDAAIARVQKQIFKCAPGAVAATKKLILSLPHMSAQEQTQHAANSFVDCMLGDEGREGVMSFLEKRKPKWAVRGDA